MPTSNWLQSGFAVSLAMGLLAGCSRGDQSRFAPSAAQQSPLGSVRAAQPVSLIPSWLHLTKPAFHRMAAPESAKKGIYVSANANNILGFNYHGTGGPLCTITGVNPVNDVAVDGRGNLVDPDGSARSIIVFQGPTMCGSQLGKVNDPYGQPADASAFNAATGKIAVANITSGSNLVGSLSICTLARGCTKNYSSPNITGFGGGVVMDHKGNCWMSSMNYGFSGAALTYFPACKGSGQAATGFNNAYYGGLTIDNAGNLLSIDFYTGGGGQLWVYKGCDPACAVVAGPFPLQGEPSFGKLNRAGTRFAVLEFNTGLVDVYAYRPTTLTYLYSFSSGYSPSQNPEGISYSPRSKQ
jgi:hypothetical protein